MKAYGKVFSARLEPKEATWLDCRIKNTKLTTSIVIRNLIREKIALEAAIAPRPQAATNPLAGKTVSDWFKENVPKKAEAQPQ